MSNPAEHTTGSRLKEEMQRYRAAQAAANAAGLTDEQIDALHDSMFPAPSPIITEARSNIRAFARAVIGAYLAQRQPLSDERIAQGCEDAERWRDQQFFEDGVRFAEREHGIGAAGPASSKQERALDALANDGLVAELERQPDCWAVFAEVRGQMVLQWPPRLTKEDAERDAEFYLPGTKTEVRPMYAGPAGSQKGSPEGAQD